MNTHTWVMSLHTQQKLPSLLFLNDAKAAADLQREASASGLHHCLGNTSKD